MPVFPRRRRLCYKISRGRTLPYAWNPLIPVTNRTISLPTRYVLAIVPFVIRRPWSSGLGWPGLSGVVAFPKLSKLLNQEDALSAPWLTAFSQLRGPIKVARCGFPWEKTTKRPNTSICANCETAYAVNSALRRRRPRGAQECCGQAEPFNLMSPYRFGSPSHHARKR